MWMPAGGVHAARRASSARKRVHGLHWEAGGGVLDERPFVLVAERVGYLSRGVANFNSLLLFSPAV